MKAIPILVLNPTQRQLLKEQVVITMFSSGSLAYRTDESLTQQFAVMLSSFEMNESVVYIIPWCLFCAVLYYE